MSEQQHADGACIGIDTDGNAIIWNETTQRGENSGQKASSDELANIAMPEATFIAIRASCCPYCRTNEFLTAGRAEVDMGGASQDVECGHCGAEWTENYTLSGYTPR